MGLFAAHFIYKLLNLFLYSFLQYSYIQFLYLFYIQINSENIFLVPCWTASKTTALNNSICCKGHGIVENSGQNMNHIFPISNPPLLLKATFILTT